MLYRVFPSSRVSPLEPGGALFVPRGWQDGGRHDNPDHYGALYLATTPVAAVAERLQALRGQTLGAQDLRRAGGRALTLAQIDDTELGDLVDLDEPALHLVDEPIALTIDLDVVIEAADRLGVRVLR